jgi:hypothetical protein
MSFKEWSAAHKPVSKDKSNEKLKAVPAADKPVAAADKKAVATGPAPKA